MFNKLAVIEDLLEGRDVSRETINKLEIYYTLLKKWNSAYNLVENESLQKAINRHYLDSIQLYKLIDPNKSLVDVGAGAGFPGMVIAILGASKVTLVESNRKKCLFMNEVARLTSTSVNILNSRIEQISDNYEQVTARAFSSLLNLLLIIKNVSRETNAVGYFLKGESWQEEIKLCERKGWEFSYNMTSSLTHEKAAIIKIWDIKNNEASQNYCRS